MKIMSRLRVISLIALALLSSDFSVAAEKKTGVLIAAITHANALNAVSKDLTQSAQNILQMNGNVGCDRQSLAVQELMTAATDGIHAIDSVVGPVMILGAMSTAEDQKVAEGVVFYEVNFALKSLENAIARVNNRATSLTSQALSLESQRIRDSLVKAREDLQQGQRDL
jgi:hypothetical protein